MKKLLILICTVVLFGFEAKAQQDPLFTQYAFNQVALNPGVAGSHEGISMTAMSRVQWSGFDGAPQTHIFSAHTGLKNNMGVGMTFLHDKIGVSQQNELGLIYSYSLQFENSTLSFGARGVFNWFQTRLLDVNLGNINDPRFQGNELNDLGVNFGTGLYYYSDRFYAGISMPFLTKNRFQGNTDITFVKDRSYYIIGGYVFDLSPEFKLRPYTNIKVPRGAPVQVDLNASLIYNETIFLGMGVRPGDAFSVMFEWQIKNIRLGYASDFASNDSDAFGRGAHEFLINYIIPTKKDPVVSPRYF